MTVREVAERLNKMVAEGNGHVRVEVQTAPMFYEDIVGVKLIACDQRKRVELELGVDWDV